MQQDLRDELFARIKLSDFSHYLIAKKAASAQADPLLALFGFYLELTEIGFRVEDHQLRAIRLQWWREAIERLGQGQMSGHPICDALDDPLQAHGEELRNALLDVIDGVEAELVAMDILTREQLFEGFRLRFGGLIKAQLQLLGVGGEETVRLIRPASDAIGIAALFAGQLGVGGGIGYMLPQELLDRHSLVASEVMQSGNVAKTARLFDELSEPLILAPLDIRQLLSEFASMSRLPFSNWYLAGLLFKKALKCRKKGDYSLIRLNPIMIYFYLNRFWAY